jgi:hypothetical protein
MAVGALLPLILGGGFALDRQKKKRTENERRGLSSAFGAEIGNRESPGQSPTLFNDQGLDVGQLSGAQAIPGSGLMGQTNDPMLQQQMEAARNIFGTKGGEDMGRSMLATALQSQQANATAQRSFAQQDKQQEDQFVNSNNQAQAQLDQSDLHHQERIMETRRLKQEDIAREAAAFAQAHSISGTPRPGFNRIQDPNGAAGEWVSVPDAANPLYIEASGKVDGLAGQIERMDSMMSLFNEVGTNAFGEKGGELESRYTAAKLNMKNVFELGVLSADDERLLTDVMQDPNGFHAATTGDKTIIAGYQNAMEVLQRALKTENQKYQYWGIGSDLDKTTPSQQKAIDLEIKQREEEAAAGFSQNNNPALREQSNFNTGGGRFPGRNDQGGGGF